MDIQCFRIMIPADAECPKQIRDKWNGKIVSKEGADYWSLEGRQDEGVGITCPGEWITHLDEQGEKIAKLLCQTFWHRTFYTEDKSILNHIKKD